MPTAGDLMEPLRDAIRNTLIPMLIRHELNDLEMELMTLPACYGGMSFDDPVADSPYKHTDSLECTANLTGLILEGDLELPQGLDLNEEAKAKIKKHHCNSIKQRLMICSLVCQNHSVKLWNWLTIPIQNIVFSLKSSLIFMITFIFDIAGHSPISHQHASVVRTSPLNHAQICKLSGFINMRHDDPTIFLAKCMKEVYHAGTLTSTPNWRDLSPPVCQHRA